MIARFEPGVFIWMPMVTGPLGKMARPEGFEPPAPRFVVWCSIQLSYGRAGERGT